MTKDFFLTSAMGKDDPYSVTAQILV